MWVGGQCGIVCVVVLIWRHGSLSIIVDVGSCGVCSRLSIDSGKEPGCDHFEDVLVDHFGR